MTPDVGLLPVAAPPRHEARPALPLLIQVPALRGPVGRATRRPSKARRRRLRREVRLGGAAILLGLPVTCAVLALAGPWPGWGRDDASGDELAAPVVVLTPRLEPAPGGEATEAPIVRPSGYLLPELRDVDAPEGADHAGS